MAFTKPLREAVANHMPVPELLGGAGHSVPSTQMEPSLTPMGRLWSWSTPQTSRHDVTFTVLPDGRRCSVVGCRNGPAGPQEARHSARRGRKK
jgi:hypothetical protein